MPLLPGRMMEFSWRSWTLTCIPRASCTIPCATKSTPAPRQLALLSNSEKKVELEMEDTQQQRAFFKLAEIVEKKFRDDINTVMSFARTCWRRKVWTQKLSRHII